MFVNVNFSYDATNNTFTMTCFEFNQLKMDNHFKYIPDTTKNEKTFSLNASDGLNISFIPIEEVSGGNEKTHKICLSINGTEFVFNANFHGNDGARDNFYKQIQDAIGTDKSLISNKLNDAFSITTNNITLPTVNGKSYQEATQEDLHPLSKHNEEQIQNVSEQPVQNTEGLNNNNNINIIDTGNNMPSTSCLECFQDMGEMMNKLSSFNNEELFGVNEAESKAVNNMLSTLAGKTTVFDRNNMLLALFSFVYLAKYPDAALEDIYNDNFGSQKKHAAFKELKDLLSKMTSHSTVEKDAAKEKLREYFTEGAKKFLNHKWPEFKDPVHFYKEPEKLKFFLLFGNIFTVLNDYLPTPDKLDNELAADKLFGKDYKGKQELSELSLNYTTNQLQFFGVLSSMTELLNEEANANKFSDSADKQERFTSYQIAAQLYAPVYFKKLNPDMSSSLDRTMTAKDMGAVIAQIQSDQEIQNILPAGFDYKSFDLVDLDRDQKDKLKILEKKYSTIGEDGSRGLGMIDESIYTESQDGTCTLDTPEAPFNSIFDFHEEHPVHPKADPFYWKKSMLFNNNFIGLFNKSNALTPRVSMAALSDLLDARGENFVNTPESDKSTSKFKHESLLNTALEPKFNDGAYFSQMRTTIHQLIKDTTEACKSKADIDKSSKKLAKDWALVFGSCLLYADTHPLPRKTFKGRERANVANMMLYKIGKMAEKSPELSRSINTFIAEHELQGEMQRANIDTKKFANFKNVRANTIIQENSLGNNNREDIINNNNNNIIDNGLGGPGGLGV